MSYGLVIVEECPHVCSAYSIKLSCTAYLNDDTIKEYSDCVDVIQTAVDEGHAIGFEHGPSAQASYLTSQGVIEEMFQDIITNGTDVETAAKAAEDKLNDIFDTMIS